MLFQKKYNDRSEVRKECEKLINTLIKPYEREEKDYTSETFFSEINSLRIIELVVLTEKKFHISLPTERLVELSDNKSLDTYVDMIAEQIGVTERV